MLTYRFTAALSKLLFSVVLFSLFLIAICDPDPFYLADMLEYPAAGAVVSLGASLLFEYIRKSEKDE